MGDLGNIFNSINNDVTGGGQASAAGLAKRGYQQYQAGQAPALNMGAYGPNAQTQINPQLAAQLQAQANGTAGPSMAQQQLQSGVNANLASAIAAGTQRGNQNPGMQERNIQNQLASINQQGAGQAAETRAREQLAAQGQAIGLSTNQANLNQANSQFNTQSAQNANTAQQSQYQYGQSLAANQQGAENQAISGLAANALQNNATFGTGLLQGAGNAAVQGAQWGAQKMFGGSGSSAPADSGVPVNSSGDLAASAADADNFAATGRVVTQPTNLIAGEAGPEAIVPLHEDGTINEEKATGPGIHELLASGKITDEGLAAALHSRGKTPMVTMAGALAAMHDRVSALESKKGK